jgi:Right handed beta helix region
MIMQSHRFFPTARRLFDPIRSMLVLIALSLSLLGVNAAAAATYYVSPSASAGGDGSAQSPWNSIGAAFQSGRVKGGDDLLLSDGEYGFLQIRNRKFKSPLTISAAPGAQPHFERINITASRNITLRGLQVWPNNPTNELLVLVRTSTNSPDIVLDRLDVRSKKDPRNYQNWSKRDWFKVKVNGILAQGARNVISNSTISGTYHAMMIEGKGASLLNNQVIGFSGDASRALGDNSTVRGNRIRDCVHIDNNHADGFQTWSRGANGKPNIGTVRGLTIQNNLIEEWTGAATNPLICNMQGIFLGGYLDDLTIENNVISVSAFHGIAAYGVTRGRIVNNTLVNSRGPSAKQPWIGVFADRKRGSRQVVVANNVAPVFKVNSNPKQNDRQLANIVLRYPSQQLRDVFNSDYRPKPGSMLINAGNAQLAPGTDIDGVSRRADGRPDIGAYEAQ